ncbi:MAG TPA: PIN domain-containing protein [Solirubrobacteraceae bacterium]|nr:PIN domain-containing protein [Solirubrobacteraceae bacterium]
MAGLTVLDASVLIASFDSSDAHSRTARASLLDADALAAWALTLARILVGPTRIGKGEKMQAAPSDLGIRSVPPLAGSAPAVAALRAEAGFLTPDSCVLYTAITISADAIATRDCRLRRAAAERGFQTP